MAWATSGSAARAAAMAESAAVIEASEAVIRVGRKLVTPS
jgi:hypothetical protein